MFPTTTKCRRSRFGQGDKGGDVSSPRRQCRQEQACLFIASFGDFSYRTGHQRPGFANQPAACDHPWFEERALRRTLTRWPFTSPLAHQKVRSGWQ